MARRARVTIPDQGEPIARIRAVADVATDIVYIARDLLGLPPVPASFRVQDPGIPSDQVIDATIEALLAG